MSNEIKTDVTFETPQVPNYIRVRVFKEPPNLISVADLSDEALDAISKQWKIDLFQRKNEVLKSRARP